MSEKANEITIRNVTEEDAAELLGIYAYYVKNTAITFEYEVPSEEEFRGRIRHISEKYPYLAAVRNGKIIGYAYAGPFVGREAYSWSTELTIYLDHTQQKKGTGRLLTEIRTKSAPGKIWEELTPYKNVIFAFTLSPAGIIERYEHGTPSLSARIESAAKALDRGFPVRLCFDPIIVCSSWREAYADMVSQVSSSIDMRKLVDVSVGSFRISAEYLGRMRRAMPGSALVQYPYEISSGYYHYPRKLMEDMEGFLTGQLAAHMDKEQIFRWDNQ